jgi:hypothetical protein
MMFSLLVLGLPLASRWRLGEAVDQSWVERGNLLKTCVAAHLPGTTGF